MSLIYSKWQKIPIFIAISDKLKPEFLEKLIKSLDEALSERIEWPTLNMAEVIPGFTKDCGYERQFELPNYIDDRLLIRAFTTMLKQKHKNLDISPEPYRPYGTINNFISEPKDWLRVANDILDCQDPITLNALLDIKGAISPVRYSIMPIDKDNIKFLANTLNLTSVCTVWITERDFSVATHRPEDYPRFLCESEPKLKNADTFIDNLLVTLSKKLTELKANNP